MLFLKRLNIIFLAWTLVLPHQVQAIDVNTLSEQELVVVKKLGFSESDLKSIDTDELKDSLKEKLDREKEELQQEAREKLQAVVKEKIEPKIEEIRSKVEKEKDELKKDATKLAAGYITSTISLFAATLIAPQVIMVCRTKPSAVVYAGSAAVYVFQEMRNIKVLKASQLAEIELINNISVDKTKSAKENAKMLEDKVDQQVGYIKAYKSTLDNAVKALKNKAKNAKIVSIGFLAASATAAAEQMDWISGGGTCTATASLEKINFSKKLDEKYAALIEQSAKTEDKWAYYYEWESLKFGTQRALTAAEIKKLKGTQVTSGILINAMNFIQANLLASALAAEDSKKVTLVKDLKNNKASDWIGDLDKLGIVGGLAINVVAYMAGWQMGFLKSIMASGTSRAITFGVQGALAFTAGKLFENAATDMEKKLAKVDDLINKIQSVAKKGINLAIPSDQDARRFQEIAAKFGVPSDKLITEMSLNDATAYIKKVKVKAENLDDEGKALLLKYEADISSKFKDEALEKVEEIKKDASTSSFPNVINMFFTDASASTVDVPQVVTKIKDINCVEKRSCPPVLFPKFNNGNLVLLNQYISLYERYYEGVKNNNELASGSAYNALVKNKNLVANFRAGVFKKIQEKGKSFNSDYSQFENAGILSEVNKFSNFYSSLSPEDKLNMNAQMNPMSPVFSANSVKAYAPGKFNGGKNLKLNAEERNILSLLINRLQANESSELRGPDMSFIQRDKIQEDEYNFGSISIHPKESELFEIIHIRYLKFMKKTFPEL